ncbi:MAG: hypothetical protein JWM11_2601 [Planctomycetaceae bacterium]|nr:hypothetical protein [Planctomycetaceae bacterium]
MLARILKDFPIQRFLDDYYLKLPFAQVHGCQEVIPAYDRATLLRILRQENVDFFAGRGGQRWTGAIPSSAQQLEALLSEGYTAGIRHAERHDPDLAKLAEEFRLELGAPINIHIYCTPQGNPGFGWHYDAEEVFILQAAGEKEWFLRKNTVNPWPLIETIPANQRYEREIMPVMHCRLSAGDWLYIPNGYWHRTAADRESISLSVGVEAVSATQVFDFLRPRLLHSLQWRQRLPCAGSVAGKSLDELTTSYREIMQSLSRDLVSLLNDEYLARSFLESLQSGNSANSTGPDESPGVCHVDLQ